MSKICTKCNINKPLTEFSTRRASKDGLSLKCKNCQQVYNRSLDPMFRSLYRGIKRRLKFDKSYSKRKLYFTWEEFQIFKPQFVKVYNKWVEHNYLHKFVPSVDRIDNAKDYSLDNIQIITKSENTKKDLKGEKHGSSKLTKKQVIEIRRLWETGAYTQKWLGDRFGVTLHCIYRIVHRKTWKHI